MFLKSISGFGLSTAALLCKPFKKLSICSSYWIKYFKISNCIKLSKGLKLFILKKKRKRLGSFILTFGFKLENNSVVC